MAKAALLNVLTQHLGKYVDGLSKENLRVGLFSGNLELKNVSLKSDVFDSLNLPIRLVYGTIKSIRVTIPWMNLGKAPVSVSVNGVFLQVEFCEENKYSAEELEEITLKLKNTILEKTQRRSFSQACSNLKLSSAAYRIETAKHQSFSSFIQTYAQRVLAKLLFNIEAVITNVHIRYTDRISSSRLIAAGVTIQTISLVTPNNVQPPQGPLNSIGNLIQVLSKVARVENLCVYWDCQATGITTQDSARVFNYRSKKSISEDGMAFDLQEWESAMMNVISTASNNTSKNFLKNCIVSAPNLFEFHIKHHPTADNNSIPKLEITCNIALFKAIVDQSQLEQIVDLLRRVAVQQKRLKMTLFRPQHRPTQDPRGWWIYAYQLVTGREDLIHKYRNRLQDCLNNRDRYIDLVIKGFKPVETNEFLPHDPLEAFIIANHVPQQLSEDETKEKNTIETLLPIQALIVYQNLAMEFLVRKEFTAQVRKRDEEEEVKAIRKAKENSSYCWPGKAVVRSAKSAAKSVRHTTHRISNSTTSVRGSMMRSIRSLVPMGTHLAVNQSSDISFAEFEKAVEEELEASEIESRQDILLLRLNLNIRFSVTVTVNRKVVLEATAAVESVSTFYSQTHVCCTCNVTELLVEEKICPNSRKPVILALYKVHGSEDHTEAEAAGDADDGMLAVAKGTIKAITSFGHSLGGIVKELEGETMKGVASIGQSIGGIVKELEDETKKGVSSAISLVESVHIPVLSEKMGRSSRDAIALNDQPAVEAAKAEGEAQPPSKTHGKGLSSKLKSIRNLWAKRDAKDSPTNARKRKLWIDSIKDSRVSIGTKTTRSQRMLNSSSSDAKLHSVIQLNYEYNASGRSSVQITANHLEVNLNLDFLYQFTQEFVKTVANLQQALRSFWSGDFISQAPRCGIETNRSNGKSTVKITDAISDRDSNIFKKYFHKFVANLKSFIGEHLVIEFAASYPRIFVDANFCGEVACAVVDIGSIGVTGFISAAAHNFELSTVLNDLSVTCGPPLPSVAGSRQSIGSVFSNRELPGSGLGYLLRPVVLNAKFSNTNVTSSDGTIYVNIEGTTVDGRYMPVTIDLDSERCIKLLALAEVAVDIAAELQVTFSRYPILFAVPEANLFDHFTDKVTHMNHLRNMVTVDFSCQEMNINYVYPSPCNSRELGLDCALALTVSEVRGMLNHRIFDTKLLLVISSFSIADTFRPAASSVIVAAKHKDDEDASFPLIQLSLAFGNQKKTNAAQAVFPDFEASFSFEILEINIDAQMLFHISTILNPVVQHVLTRLVERQISGVANIPGKIHRYEWTPASQSQPTGAFVTAVANRRVSLFEEDIVKLAFKIEKLDIRTSIVDITEDGEFVIVPICHLSLCGLNANGALSKGIPRRGRASIGALTMYDSREISKEFFYKKILDASNRNADGKADFAVVEYSNVISNNDQVSNQLLTAIVSGVQLTACVDVLVDVGSTLIGIAFASIHLLSPEANIQSSVALHALENQYKPMQFRVPGVRVPTPAIQVGYSASPVNHSNTYRQRRSLSSSNLKVKFSAYNTSIILLADPMNEATTSLTASCMADVVIIINDVNTNDHVGRVTNESLVLSVSHIDLGFVSDTGKFLKWRGETDGSPTVEVGLRQAASRQEFSIDCNLRRELKQLVPVVAEVSVSVGNIDFSLSVDNIQTAANVISRAAYAGLSFVVVPDNSIAYCIWGSHNAKEERVMYDVTISTGKIVFEAVSDTVENGLRTPNLRFTVHSCNLKFDGALHPRIYVDSTSIIIEVDIQDVDGSGLIMCSTEYNHPVAKQWESVIEPFDIILNLSERNNEISLAVNISDNLQINLSGAVIETFLYQYAKLLWLKNSGSIVHRRDVVAVPENQALRKPSLVSKGIALLEPYRNNAWTRSLLQSSLRWKRPQVELPKVSLTNAFLSSIKFVLTFNSSHRSANMLSPGEKLVIDNHNFDRCTLVIKIGEYDWSNDVIISLNGSWKQEFVIKKNEKEITRLVVEAWDNRSMESVEECYYEIVIYAMACFIDATGFGLSTLASVGRKNVVRATHGSNGVLSTKDKAEEISNGYRSSSSTPSERPIWDAGFNSIAAPNSWEELQFFSQRMYRSDSHMKVGKKVYTDRSYVWSYIPPLFRKQLYCATACSDYGSCIKTLVQFRCLHPVFVFVMVESSALADVMESSSSEEDLHWLHTEGYCKVNSTLVATQKVTAGSKTLREERHFIPFGKFFKENDIVSLGMAGSLGKRGFMYTICLVHTSLVSKNDSASVGILHSVLNAPCMNHDVAEMAWLDGSMGLNSFHCDNDDFAVGFVNDNCWSSQLKLKTLTSDKQYVEVDNQSQRCRYQLACQLTRMPGLFFRTKKVKMMPYYCLLNCCDEFIDVVQCDKLLQNDSVSTVRFHPYESKSWHKMIGISTSVVRFKTESSQWSFGGVDINEIGSSLLLLIPENNNGQREVLHVDVRLASENDSCAVTIVIWKESAFTGISLSISNETSTPLAISQADLEISTNGSSMSLLPLRRGSVTVVDNALPNKSDYTIVAPPRTRVPFGWTDPSKFTDAINVSIFSADKPNTHNDATYRLDILTLNEVNKVSLPGIQSPLFIIVQAQGNGKVVRIVNSIESLGHGTIVGVDIDHQPAVSSTTTSGAVAAGAVIGTLLMGPIGTVLVGGGTYVLISKVNADAKAKLNIDLANIAEERARQLLTDTTEHVQRIRTKNFDGYSSNINFALNVTVGEFSIGLFVEKPERREFMTLYVDEFCAGFKFNTVSRSTELSIKNIQLDSYSETAVSQIILKSVVGEQPQNSPGGGRGEEDGSRFLHFLVVEEYHPQEDTVHFKYIGMRMLELQVSVDSATLQLLAIDIGVDFNFLSTDQDRATNSPTKWLSEFNCNSLEPSSNGLLENVRSTQLISQEKRIFIENLVIHPIKVSLTFAQTSLPRKLEQLPTGLLSVGLLSFVPTFAALDNATIHLESFIVCNVMESLNSLVSRVITSKLRDLQYQLAPLVGSLTAIGGPMGLAKNVGGGVRSLVYEPYQGAVRSPRGFVVGLSKGASSFVSGIVSGALNSSAGIMSTASQGISQSIVSLSGNDEFARTRIEARRRAQDAAREGVWSGLVEGGGSVLHGLSSGISGLVSMPLSQSKEGGLAGLVTGFGMGVVNVGVSPILGVSDGINSVAQTVITQLNTSKIQPFRRPPRSLQRVTVDCTRDASIGLASDVSLEVHLILAARKPLSRKTTGQSLVFSDHLERGAFPIMTSIGNNTFVILSKKYMHIKRIVEDRTVMNGLVQVNSTMLRDVCLEQALSQDVIMRWRDVSHFTVTQDSSSSIVQIMSCNEDVPGIDIQCQDPKLGLELCRALQLCASYMKNPQHIPDLSALAASSLLLSQSVLVANGESNSNDIIPFACQSNSLLLMNSLNYASTLQRSSYSMSPRSIRIRDESIEEQHRPKVKSGLTTASSQLIGITGGAKNGTSAASDVDDRMGNLVAVEGTSAAEYKFGKANGRPLAATMCFFSSKSSPTAKASNSRSINSNNDMFKNVLQELSLVSLFTAEHISPSTKQLLKVTATIDAWERIDEIMWQIIKEWSTLHRDIVRCSALAVINESESTIAFSNIELKIGKGVKVLPGPGYVPSLKALVPGGCVLFFIWGDEPSLMSEGHAKVYIESSQVSFSLSTKRVKVRTALSTITSKSTVVKRQQNADAESQSSDNGGGVGVEFLEVSSDQKSWCKFVVRVKD